MPSPKAANLVKHKTLRISILLPACFQCRSEHTSPLAFYTVVACGPTLENLCAFSQVSVKAAPTRYIGRHRGKPTPLVSLHLLEIYPQPLPWVVDALQLHHPPPG